MANTGYPEAEAQERQIARRHQRGTRWRWLFQVSTIVGIVALTALLYNVLNESFGLVAVQNAVDPADLVVQVEEARLLAASDTTVSEDDNELVAAIAADPLGIGFFGYAYYQNNAADLQLVAVDGAVASGETAVSDTYPFDRPLYIYTTADVLQQNQAATVFVNYYLTHVGDEVEDVGYFLPSEAGLARARANWVQSNELDLAAGQWATINPEGVDGSVKVAGSSTVLPLTERLAQRIGAAGFAGQVQLQGTGTTAGIAAFCAGEVDIVNASRPLTASEYGLCAENGRLPLEFEIATDALALVVSSSNSFLQNVTQEELRHIFTDATTWADVNSNWPNEPIHRYIPGANSGSLDFLTSQLFPIPLADLPTETLVEMLAANISVGLGRRLEREQRFFADRFVFEDPALFAEVCASAEPAAGCTLEPRSATNIYELVLERVVAPDVVRTWSLVDSIFNRATIEAQAAEQLPGAQLQFRSWLTSDFLVSPQSSTPEFAGVRTAILGSLWVVLITIIFSFPVGVGAAIYLEEYATDNQLNRLIQTNINNLAGVPSIIYGMLGLAIFVRTLESFTSGAALGIIDDATTANGRTIISAGLTLGLLILPLIIINAQEAIRAVPSSLRQAGFALGATQWQTIWHHVLPSAMPGILTGTILAISRAIGETAPLVVVGASTFITIDPSGPFSKFTTLPIQIYQWTARPQAEFRNIAAAAIVVLLVLLLTLNATAVFLRNRYSQRAA